ncbi:MAG: ABC transporter ATP-binding protein [Chloroflexota bacterium]|nr:ABC transporter ATP-binding protein [Chloroflexota bacterium]
MLVLDNVHTYYGHIHALKGVSLRVEQGEIVTLIGSNGAGKTTTLNTISGLFAPRTGTITLEGKTIAHTPAHEVAKLGVSQAPEGRKIFARLTVQENLEMGAFYRTDSDEIKADYERVLELFPRLQERLKQPGGTLSGGEQQMLAIGRALMSRPRILLLDEPSMGLAPILVQIIFEIIYNINQQGTTILLVEQNAHAALELANRGYVLQTGKIVLSDTAAELRKNPMVQRVYLGID